MNIIAEIRRRHLVSSIAPATTCCVELPMSYIDRIDQLKALHLYGIAPARLGERIVAPLPCLFGCFREAGWSPRCIAAPRLNL